jgi:hypothetical protein
MCPIITLIQLYLNKRRAKAPLHENTHRMEKHSSVSCRSNNRGFRLIRCDTALYVTFPSNPTTSEVAKHDSKEPKAVVRSVRKKRKQS